MIQKIPKQEEETPVKLVYAVRSLMREASKQGLVLKEVGLTTRHMGNDLKPSPTKVLGIRITPNSCDCFHNQYNQ